MNSVAKEQPPEGKADMCLRSQLSAVFFIFGAILCGELFCAIDNTVPSLCAVQTWNAILHNVTYNS